jgi:hypothetical protein
MRQAKKSRRAGEKEKRAGEECSTPTAIPLVKIRTLRVSHPCLSVRIRGLNSAFKIKNPPHPAGKIGKVMQGKARAFCPKKFAIFSRHIPGKSLGNRAKTTKKAFKNAQKTGDL